MDTMTKPATKTFDRTMEGLKDGVADATHGAEMRPVGPTGMATGTMADAAQRLMSFHQGNLAAATQSGQILADGMQDLAKQMTECARAALDEGMRAFQTLAATKSIQNAVEVQTGFVRARSAGAMNDASRLSEGWLRLMERAAAPIGARVTATKDLLRN